MADSKRKTFKTAVAAERVRTRDMTSRHPTRKRKFDINEGEPVKSPPAGGKSTAGGPTATGTKLAGSNTVSPIPGPSNTVTLQPANAAPYRCQICERPYETKSGLNKHLLTCGKRDRTKCQYCKAGFTTYTGVRLHEQRAHPEAENDSRRRELRRPDSEIYDILANIEIQSHKGPFMAKMVAESGLTKDQIRHRRDKPIYKQYLDAARKKQQPIPSPSVPCEPPTCPTNEKIDHQAATSTPPTARDDVKEGECSSAVASALSPITPDPMTSRKRIRNESMSPLSQPTVRRPRTDAVNLTANSPAQVEQTQVVIEPALREYLASEREAALANGNGHLADLCQAGSSLAVNDLASYLDNWIIEDFQKGGRKYNPNGHRGGPKSNYGGTRPGRGPRVESYKKAQDLYLRNRSALVDKIISGTPLDSTEEVPPLKAVEELYSGIFERAATETMTVHPEPRNTDATTFAPFEESELEAAKTAWANSAPGADGITVASVKNTNNRVLCVLYSIILMRNVHPAIFLRSRTTIIYKDGQRSEAANWRPLTIGSALQRLMHRAMANRLRKVVALEANQRGFSTLDGTLANCMILHSYIRNRVSSNKEYAVASLDLRKAFDTVGHGSVVGALRRFGVDERSIRYVATNLATSVTQIRVGQETTRDIGFSCGVKQGDPLSPLLFNLVIDELLAGLNNGERGGTILPGVRVSAMAFADDIVLLEDQEENIPLVLDEIVEFAKSKGMALNPKKCSAMVVGLARGVLAPRKDYKLTIDGRRVAMVTEVNSFRYLGHEASVKGLMRPSLANLPTWLANLKRSPLKPDQKFAILKITLSLSYSMACKTQR
ncbi:unnamed protein product [Acanthoscelides obtectus]|uniref:Reverse transcriptase domain-containing protein n=1 Tax=Acanthoscelides obtectus TaxID=200917 RepID=A0A9P0QDF2_ACAOB|nr:unnamed protein product [Acanthoscelides obtectus]CAK1687514.1 hypothetical protein AOBTE_LOCUS36274 [Acanthoscelides obtectus]